MRLKNLGLGIVESKPHLHATGPSNSAHNVLLLVQLFVDFLLVFFLSDSPHVLPHNASQEAEEVENEEADEQIEDEGEAV